MSGAPASKPSGAKGRRRLGVALALSGALVGTLGLVWNRRLHKLWGIPEAPSRSIDVSAWVPAEPRPRVRVLFVGHSLVNQDMPAMARSQAESLGRTFDYDVQLIDGGSLERNWNDAARATGVQAREALAGGGYDALVITEAVNLDDHLRWSEPADYARRWFALGRSQRADLHLYFYETWHHRDEARGLLRPLGLGSLRSWRSFLDEDLRKWESIVDNAVAGDAGLERGEPVHLVPGGQALAALVDALHAGRVPGLEGAEGEAALFTDGVHLTDLGNYFIALVQLTTLTRQSPLGATHEVLRGDGTTFTLDPELARALQGIAYDAVCSYARSGVRRPPE